MLCRLSPIRAITSLNEYWRLISCSNINFFEYESKIRILRSHRSTMYFSWLTGAYLHKEGIVSLFKRSKEFNLAVYFICGLFLLIINILLLFLGIKTSPYGYLNPVIILMSVYLFLYFRRLRIGHIHWINFLSASAFSIYLFHCNVVLGSKISDMWVCINAHFGKVTSLLLACLSFIGIYLFCVIIDRVRIFLFSTICRILESNRISKIWTYCG